MRSLAPILGVLLCLLAPARAQEPERRPPAGMVGVLRLPGLFSDDPCDPTPAKPIPLYSKPRITAPIGALSLIYTATPDPQGGCSNGRVLGLQRQGTPQAEALPTLEIAYEQPAAIALAKSGPWCQLLLSSGTAWIHEACEESFVSLEALLADKPLYLLEGAIDQARSQPGGSEAKKPAGLSRRPGQPPLSARLLGHRLVGGQTWLRLAATWVNACEGSPRAQDEFELWLPLRDAAGRPQVWFHPRGC